jgi:hypothetical protein
VQRGLRTLIFDIKFNLIFKFQMGHVSTIYLLTGLNLLKNIINTSNDYFDDHYTSNDCVAKSCVHGHS